MRRPWLRRYGNGYDERKSERTRKKKRTRDGNTKRQRNAHVRLVHTTTGDCGDQGAATRRRLAEPAGARARSSARPRRLRANFRKHRRRVGGCAAVRRCGGAAVRRCGGVAVRPCGGAAVVRAPTVANRRGRRVILVASHRPPITPYANRLICRRKMSPTITLNRMRLLYNPPAGLTVFTQRISEHLSNTEQWTRIKQSSSRLG